MESITKFVSHFILQLGRMSEKGFVWFFNLGDPIVVCIVLFILMSPIAIGYACTIKMAFIKMN